AGQSVDDLGVWKVPAELVAGVIAPSRPQRDQPGIGLPRLFSVTVHGGAERGGQQAKRVGLRGDYTRMTGCRRHIILEVAAEEQVEMIPGGTNRPVLGCP